MYVSYCCWFYIKGIRDLAALFDINNVFAEAMRQSRGTSISWARGGAFNKPHLVFQTQFRLQVFFIYIYMLRFCIRRKFETRYHASGETRDREREGESRRFLTPLRNLWSAIHLSVLSLSLSLFAKV
jgi:hypothetical protein